VVSATPSASISIDDQPSTEPKAEPKKKRPKWISTVPGYRVEPHYLATVRWLAVAQVIFTVICMWPAIKHFDAMATPNWAKIVLGLSLAQVFYLVWMWTVPDWSTLRVMVVVFASIASFYAMAMAIAYYAPPGEPAFLGWGDLRNSVTTLWCGLVVMLSGLMTYLCGRASAQWKKVFELGG